MNVPKSNHEITFSGMRPRCKLCGKTFATNSAVNKHVLEHHERDPRLSCHICGAYYLRRDNLEVH